jgi:hypothetical protein
MPESASELYRPSDRRLLANLVPTLTDRGWHVVSVTDPYGRVLGFIDRNCQTKENLKCGHGSQRGAPTQKRTGRLTFGRKINFELRTGQEFTLNQLQFGM